MNDHVSENKRPRGLLILLSLILLLGFALYVHGLVQNLPYQLEPDEPQIYRFANYLVTNGRPMNGYPPLGVFELAFDFLWLDVVTPGGATQMARFFVGRYMSVLWSVVLLAVTYQAGRMTLGRMAGLGAMLFLVAQPNLETMSKLLKTDNIAWLAGMLTFVAAIYAIRRHKRGWVLIAFVAGLAAIMGKYTMAPIMLVPVVALIAVVPSNKIQRLIVIAAGIGVTLVGILIVLNPPPPLADFLLSFHARQLYERDSVFQFVSLDKGWTGLSEQLALYNIIGAALVIPIGLFIWPRKRLSRTQTLILVMLISLMVVAFFANGLFQTNRDQDRYLVVLAFAVVWGVAVALMAQKRPAWSVLVALLLVLPWIADRWQHGTNTARLDTRAFTANYFIENVPEGVHIASEYDAVEFERGYGGFPSDKIFFVELITSVHDESLDDYARRGIEYLVADYRNINRGGFFDDVGDDEAFLAQVETLIEIPSPHDIGMKGPARYVFHIPPRQLHPDHIFLGDGVIFKGYDLPETEITPGDTLDLVLYWAALREMDASYTVFAHLLNEGGELVAQNDGLPGDALHRTYDWWAGYFDWDEWPLTIPADAPPGDYWLVVGMYDADTLMRLPAVDAQGTPLGNHIEITTLTITP